MYQNGTSDGDPTPIDILAHTEKCVVCGDLADGFHYGVRSCRGCNAFFRRAVTYNMTFTCRRGGRCQVDKNARCACRACRLAKCYAVGMDKKAVQTKRDTTVQEKSFEQTENDFDNQITRESPNGELVEMTSPGSAFTPLNNVADFIPMLPPSPPSDSCFLTKQCFDFIDQKRRRTAMLCKTLEEILSADLSLQSPAELDDFTHIFQAQMILMFEWAEKLPEFRSLHDPHDKSKLLRAFALKYMLLDNIYHTYEHGCTEKLVLVNNNYVKPGEPPASFNRTEVLSTTEIRELLYGQPMFDLLNELVIPFSKANFTVADLITLRCFLLWNPGCIGLSPIGETISKEASANTVKEMQRFYQLEGVDDSDIKKRHEFLLMYIPIFTKHSKTMHDIFRLIPSFGKMSEWNSFMDDVLHGV